MSTTEQKLREYLRRVTAELNATRDELARVATGDREPIAVLATSCRLPGGVTSPDEFWRLLATGTDAIGPLPADRGWDLDGLYDPDPDHPGTAYVREGGFVDGIADFDAGFFGISPREALAMDPQQRLVLEETWTALERARIDPTTLRGTDTGVYLGTNGLDYGALVEGVDGAEGHTLTGGAASVLAGRVSYVLGLTGPATTVDTACSSSLVAMHNAVRALRGGECSLAIAGGVNLMATPTLLVEFSRQRGLAPDCRSKAFAEAANGLAIAEGGGIVVLARLSAARAAGHPVLAVIRGSAVNQDGASNGLTAPSRQAQEQVIRSALADAGLAAADVDAVEAHGTGTALGDPIEARALLATYGQDRDTPLWLGSAKSNIGHTQAAAGVTAVVKVVEALRRRELPATLHVDSPTSHVDWTTGKVRLLTEPAPLPDRDGPYRVGVSAFGMSGTNAHMIVEQAPPSDPEPATKDVGAVPWVLSARTPDALRGQAARLLAHVTGLHPADVGRSLVTTRATFDHRAVVVGTDLAELTQRLTAVADGEDAAGVVTGTAARTGGVVFVFPGQGAEWAGMAKELMASSTVFADAVAECAAALAPHLDWSVLDVLASDDPASLSRVDVVQPVLWTVMVSLAAVWRSHGVEPAAVVGHSQGEIAAAVVAGALSLADAALIVATRSRMITEDLPTHVRMASIRLPRADVEARMGADVTVAAVNGPSATTVAGPLDAVRRLVDECVADGVRAKLMAADRATHCASVEILEGPLAAALAGVAPKTGTVPFYSTVTGAEVDTATLDAGYWYRNMRQPVDFHGAVTALAAAGHRCFVEVSSHAVLTGYLDDIVDGGVVTGTLRRDDGDARRFLTSAAHLWAHGVSIDWTPCFPGTSTVDLPTYAFQRTRHWPSARARRADGPGLGHPVLTDVVELAGDAGVVFTGRLSADTPEWLADHRLRDRIIFPGTGFVELALRAGDEVGCGTLTDLTFATPLFPPDKGGVRLQVRVDAPGEDGTRGITIHSRPDDVSGWTLHATGTLAPSTPAADTGFAELAERTSDSVAKAWPPDGATEVDLTGCYDAFAESGYGYGPSFHGLRGAWRRDGELFAEAVLPDDVPDDDHGVHPALLDAVMHALLVSGLDLPPGALPFSWQDVHLHATGARTLRARLSTVDDGAVSLVAADPGGEPVLTAASVLHRAASDTPLSRPVVEPGGLYTLDWVPVPAPEPVPDGDVTVLDGALSELDAVPDVVLVPVTGGADVVASTHDIAARVLGLMRTWLAEDRFAGSRLVFVTRDATGDGDLPAFAAWGMVRSAISENPGMFGLLDAHDDDLPVALPHLLAGHEPQLSVRDGVVFAARVAPDPATLTVPVSGHDWRLDVVTPGTVDGLGIVPADHADPVGRQVRVAVSAAGLNFLDVLGTLGYEKVRDASARYHGEGGGLGVEVAGVVTAVGGDVSGLAVGDRVMGLVTGGFAPVAVTDERNLVAVPDDWSDEIAAGVPSAFLSAMFGLVDVAGLAEGERVLIHSGAGGVGMAAIQLAQSLGAEVFATASESKWETLRALGVADDHIASSRTLDFEQKFSGAGMDVVLNSLTGEFADASLRLLAPGGRFAELGKNDLRDDTGVTYQPFDLTQVAPDRVREMLLELTGLFARGILQPLPTRSWPIRQATTAFRHMSQARHTGKIVLTIPGPWDRDKAVLLTGGTSGLGRELARHLAGQGFRHLVLASRRGPAAHGVAELVDELGAQGTRVDVAACDLADGISVRNLVADLGDLTAVVHAAGVLDDATVENLTDEQLTGVLRPKVDAAWHLHEATKGRDLAGFVVYSSVAGVLGTTGQANYAAANAFLDALCRRRKADGLPAVALSWGLWDHATGMTGGMSDVDHARIRRQGQRPIPLDRGLALFDAAVTSDAAQSVIMLVDQPALRAREDLPTILRGLVPTSRRVATRATTSAGSLTERLPGLPPAQRRDVLLDVVRRQVAVVLGFGDPDAVDAARPFKELGFDSLTAVELRNKLGAALGTKLSATLVFDYPTASALVDHLLGMFAVDASPASLKDVLDRLEAALAGPASADERRDALARLVNLTARLRGADEPSGPAGPTEDDINSVSVDDLFRLIDDNFSAQD